MKGAEGALENTGVVCHRFGSVTGVDTTIAVAGPRSSSGHSGADMLVGCRIQTSGVSRRIYSPRGGGSQGRGASPESR